MTCETDKKVDTIKLQMVEIAWEMVSILEELSNKLWSIFDQEFIEKANGENEKDIPF